MSTSIDVEPDVERAPANLGETLDQGTNTNDNTQPQSSGDTEQLIAITELPKVDCSGRHSSGFDLGRHTRRKCASQGLLNVSMFAVTATQLKYVLLTNGAHRFYIAMIVFLTSSLVLQLLHAITLLVADQFCIRVAQPAVDQATTNKDVRLQRRLSKTDTCNNLTLICTLLLLAVNALAATFEIVEIPGGTLDTTKRP